jgi:6-phosphogluconolactonase
MKKNAKIRGGRQPFKIKRSHWTEGLFTFSLVSDFTLLLQKMVENFYQWGSFCIQKQGQFSVLLSGGRTPQKFYEALARTPPPFSWKSCRFFWGDERAVPLDHPDSNFQMAYQAWLCYLPEECYFPVQTSAVDPVLTAQRYEALLKTTLDSPNTLPSLDLVLLGIGNDGHIASLFPETKALYEEKALYVYHEVPQLQTFRFTATFPLLNASKQTWILATGASKAPLLTELWNNAPLPPRYPVQKLKPSTLYWFLDTEAVPFLTS